MTINLKAPELRELKPRIMVCGVGGGGCNAVNNMIASGLSGVDFLVANTDAQALMSSRAERIIQMGLQVTEGLGAGAQPEVGRAAAEEAREEIREHLTGAHMCFVTAGMGGGTGTGAAPVIATIAREMGILTVGVVTKPFHFEGQRRLRIADSGIAELQKCVDTLIVIPNQNLFRIANEKTTFADAFAMADQVLYSGVASVTDLMVKEGLINLDFADVRSIMRGMGKAMMGTGEATGDRRAILSAEAAIANPLLDEVSMKGARGLLISITGGNDLTLYEVDEAASRIRQEVDEEANIILGATFDSSLEGVIRVSVVATGIDPAAITVQDSGLNEARVAEQAAERLRTQLAQQARQTQAAAAAVAEAAAQAPAAPAYQPAAEPPAQAYYQEAHYPDAAQYAEPVREVSAPHGVYIEPVPARQAYAEPAREHSRHYQEEAQAPYIPPAPEQPMRAPRMPQIEDFPRPGQEQLRQARGEVPVADARRKSIFERLASFGASRQEEALQHAQAPQPARNLAAPQAAPGYGRAEHPHAQPSPAHIEYAKRPSASALPASGPQAGLDQHGRRAPMPRSVEEDHLEIPAFLRRQANN
ncbi:cell division protein FtsZ [Methylocystis heyeri]|uniref:Cell division protein FtsZ n=1 Tax=Methylocystis heyeri TaxID=391905 RepID=A0A6B8KF58_9HYPH|nr:cell division protein FtsZ [Methylocystis heyeri]QGM45681.1 cell division protein FtsZ [Methylocystis heyeri]